MQEFKCVKEFVMFDNIFVKGRVKLFLCCSVIFQSILVMHHLHIIARNKYIS